MKRKNWFVELIFQAPALGRFRVPIFLKPYPGPANAEP